MRLIALGRRPHHRHQTAGLNLVESAIVLAAAAIFLGAAWVAGSQVYLNNQIRVTMQQLTSIVHNIRGLYAEQTGIASSGVGGSIVLTQGLDQLKVFPIEMRPIASNPSGTIFHIWNQAAGGTIVNCGGANGCVGYTNGTVTIDSDDCTGTEGATTPQPCFGLKYTNVPQSACLKLLNQTMQNGMGLQRVILNNIIGNPLLPPATSSQIQAGCVNATNTIEWVYLVKG